VSTTLPCASITAAEPHPAPPSYVTLVALARDGDARVGVAEMLDWKPARVAQESLVLRNEAACENCRPAAMLLHTEAAFVALQTRRHDSEKAHRKAASQIAEWLARDATAERRERVADFERRWQLAIGYQYQELIGPAPALDVYKEVYERHPKDPETLVAMGALYEGIFATPQMVAGTGVAIPLPSLYYEHALAAAPNHAEARLRLGAFYAHFGTSVDAGRVELNRVLASEPSPIIRAFAHLFLGDADSRTAHLDEAAQHYRAAIDAEPRLQTAHLALARVLQRLGRGQEAVTVMLDGLRATKDGDIVSWYAYHTSAIHGYRLSMDRLWQEVQQ
jgi:tetratricopeptide (TPR) repeat protein